MIERAKTYLEDSWIDKLKSYEITDTKYVDMFEEN